MDAPTEEKLRFTLVHGENDKARIGKFHVGDQIVDTPTFIIGTEFGHPPCISPDLLKHISNSPILFHVSLPQIWDALPVIESTKKDLAHFIGLKSSFQEDSNRDDVPPVALISGCSDLQHTIFNLPFTENEVAIDSLSGRKKITPENWVKSLQTTKPQAAIIPSPELDFYSSKKRVGRAVKLGTDFMNQIFNLIQKDKDNIFVPDIYPVISGAFIESSRTASLEDFKRTYNAHKNLISGIVLGNFGCGEDPESRKKYLKLCVKELPQNLARITTGLGSPDEILDSVMEGVDLFVSLYPSKLAESGCALVFPINYDALSTGAPLTMNLRDKVYERDWKPMIGDVVVEGVGAVESTTSEYRCECFACRRHTRAYINHLFNTHELLGSILLNLHNTYHYQRFFQEIAKRIQEGTFQEYREKFLSMWSN